MGRSEQPRSSRVPAGRASFATTQWSVVRAAGRSTGAESERALATLCTKYWYPLYAFARRRGLAAEQAADITQGFFARLLEQKIVRGADPRRGKFRSYLLARSSISNHTSGVGTGRKSAAAGASWCRWTRRTPRTATTSSRRTT